MESLRLKLESKDFDHLTEALSYLDSLGYERQFTPDEQGLSDTGSGKKYPVESLRFTAQYRFEGMSDPDDSTELFAVVTEDGIKGTLILSYGAQHSANAEIVRKITFL